MAAADATLGGFIDAIKGLINDKIIPFLFVLGTVIFIWGVVQYVIGSQGSDAKIAQGKKAMLWGIIGLTIMMSAWAIVALLCNSFLGGCQKTIPGQ